MGKKILIINLGSSSKKYAFYDIGKQIAFGNFEMSGKASIAFREKKKEYNLSSMDYTQSVVFFAKAIDIDFYNITSLVKTVIVPIEEKKEMSNQVINFKKQMRLKYLILIMIFASFNAIGQNNSDMLTFQIDGNNYIKSNYDKNGTLEDYQIIKIGEIKSDGDKNIIPVRLYNYSDNGQILDSSRTDYICDPEDRQLVMNVFPFASLNSNKTVKLKSKIKIAFYPKEWKIGEDLPNALFSANISGGALSVFGTIAKIEIYDRKIIEHDESRNLFMISSNLRITVYAYGVKIKTLEYSFEEKIHPLKGIIEQYFKESTGEFFTIKLKT